MSKVVLIGKGPSNGDSKSPDFLQVSNSALVCAESDESEDGDENCDETPVHGYLMSAIDSYNDHMICHLSKKKSKQGRKPVKELDESQSSPLYTPIKLAECEEEFPVVLADEKGDKRIYESCSEISESSCIDPMSIPSKPLFTPVKIPLGINREHQSTKPNSCDDFREVESSGSSNFSMTFDASLGCICMMGELGAMERNEMESVPVRVAAEIEKTVDPKELVEPAEPTKPIDPVLSLISQFYYQQPRKQLTKVNQKSVGMAVSEEQEKTGNHFYQSVPTNDVERHCDGNFPSISPSALLPDASNKHMEQPSQPEPTDEHPSNIPNSMSLSPSCKSYEATKNQEKQNRNEEDHHVVLEEAEHQSNSPIELAMSSSCKTFDREKRMEERDTVSDGIKPIKKSMKNSKHTPVQERNVTTTDQEEVVDIPVGCSASTKNFTSAPSNPVVNYQVVRKKDSESHDMKLSESSSPVNVFQDNSKQVAKEIERSESSNKQIKLKDSTECSAPVRKHDETPEAKVHTGSQKLVSDPVTFTEQLDCSDEVELRLSRSSKPFKTYKLVEKPSRVNESNFNLKDQHAAEIQTPFGQPNLENMRDHGCEKMAEKSTSVKQLLVTSMDNELRKLQDHPHKSQLVTLKSKDCGCQKDDTANSEVIILDSTTGETDAPHTALKLSESSQNFETLSLSNYQNEVQAPYFDELNDISLTPIKTHKDVGVNCRMRRKCKATAVKEKPKKLDPICPPNVTTPPACTSFAKHRLQKGSPKNAQPQANATPKFGKCCPPPISPLVTNSYTEYKVIEPPFKSPCPPNERSDVLYQKSIRAAIHVRHEQSQTSTKNLIKATYNPAAGCSDWDHQVSNGFKMKLNTNTNPTYPLNECLPVQTDLNCRSLRNSLMNATYDPLKGCTQNDLEENMCEPIVLDATYDSTTDCNRTGDSNPPQSSTLIDATYDSPADCSQTNRNNAEYQPDLPMNAILYTPAKDCIRTPPVKVVKKSNLVDSTYEACKDSVNPDHPKIIHQSNLTKASYNLNEIRLEASQGGANCETNLMNATYDPKEDCDSNDCNTPDLKLTAKKNKTQKYKTPAATIGPSMSIPRIDCAIVPQKILRTTGQPGPGPLRQKKLSSQYFHASNLSSEKSTPGCSMTMMMPEIACGPPSKIGKGYYIPTSEQVKREWDVNCTNPEIDNVCAPDELSKKSYFSYELSSKVGEKSEYTKYSYTEESLCEESISCVTETELSAQQIRSSSVDPKPENCHNNRRTKSNEFSEVPANIVKPQKSKSEIKCKPDGQEIIKPNGLSAPEYNPHRDLRKMHDGMYWAFHDECKGERLRAQAHADLEKMDSDFVNKRLCEPSAYPAVPATFDFEIPRHWLRPSL